MLADESCVRILPSLEEFEKCMGAIPLSAGRYFVYYVKATINFGQEEVVMPRVALLTDLTVEDDTVTISCISELHDPDRDPWIAQEYRDAVITGRFDGFTVGNATITYDEFSHHVMVHPFFHNRPREVTVGSLDSGTNPLPTF